MRRAAFTDAQWRLLQLLYRSESEDRPVRSSRHTSYSPAKVTACSTTADRLVLLGLARWSQPNARYLLITGLGRRAAEVSTRREAASLLLDSGLTTVSAT